MNAAQRTLREMNPKMCLPWGKEVSSKTGGVVKLNLGCGGSRPQGWWNGDSSLNSYFQQFRLQLGKVQYKDPASYIEIRKPWPFPNSSCAIVYASHVLEHLSRNDVAFFFCETRRVLRPGGVLRLVVPDLYLLAHEYVQQARLGNGAAHTFLKWLNLHREGAYPEPIPWHRRLVHAWQGWPHQHKYMYDKWTLEELYHRFGFDEVRHEHYGHSTLIPEIRDVEHTSEGVASIYLEAGINK
jgi:predicted SAM-dependent methyltransferase